MTVASGNNMSITTIGENLIHYEALGRGEPLIFIHGWLGSWRYWWSSMQALSTHYRTFAFDLWGFGDSSKPADKYSFDEYVEMLNQFVERLGIVHPVTIVGHSLGAAVGLRYATQHPEAVQRLAAVAMPVRGQYIHNRLAQNDSESFISRVLGRNNTYPEIEAELRKTDSAAMNKVAGELLQADFAAELDEASIPVLLVFGADDPVIRQPSGEDHHLQETHDRRAYILLESCHHFPMLEEGAKFNRLILDFLRSNNNLSELSPKETWKRRTH